MSAASWVVFGWLFIGAAWTWYAWDHHDDSTTVASIGSPLGAGGKLGLSVVILAIIGLLVLTWPATLVAHLIRLRRQP